ncbi:DUF4270 family protein [Bacteroidota bacterium]
MRTEKHNYFYLSLILFFFTLLSACEEKPDFIGRELLPSGDNFTVSFDSLEVVYGYTNPADSTRIRYKQYHLIGNIRDPFFGSSTGTLVSTISNSSTSKGFGPNPVMDSVIFFMGWDDLIGEGLNPLTLNVYEFMEFVRFDTSYYSNWDVSGKYKEPPLGTTTVYRSDTLAKIYINDQEFFDKFLTAEDSILGSGAYLQELIYGLYFTTDDAGDEGGIFRVDFDNTLLRFYYHNDTALELTQYYSLDNNTNGRVNLFSHDVSGFPIESYLGHGSDNDSLLFVQSMSGVNSRIRFPDFNHWLDSSHIAINEAILIIPMADTSITMQQSKYFCESLILYLVNEDGTYSRTHDSWIDPGSFGGEYKNGAYTFTVKVQLQSILAGNVENLEMVLVSNNTTETVRRAGLYGWNSNDPGKRIRLEITYTKL